MSSEKMVFKYLSYDKCIEYANVIAEYEGKHPDIVFKDILGIQLKRLVWIDEKETYEPAFDTEYVMTGSYTVISKNETSIIFKCMSEYKDLTTLYQVCKTDENIELIKVKYPATLEEDRNLMSPHSFIQVDMNVKEQFIIDFIKDIKIEGVHMRIIPTTNSIIVECRYVPPVSLETEGV